MIDIIPILIISVAAATVANAVNTFDKQLSSNCSTIFLR